MWYAIISRDVPNNLPLRKQARPAHLERLNQLQNEGRLLTAGPFPAIDSEAPGDNGFSGSLIIAEFDNLTEAEIWANEDPYMSHGVYSSSEVKPYKKVF